VVEFEPGPVSAQTARKTWRTLEPIHGCVYFVPETAARYRALGLDDRQGYFASRVAAMGEVPAEVVLATFVNFHPSLVKRCIPSAWELASHEEVLEARFEGIDEALRRMLGEAIDSPELAEAAELARAAAQVAVQRPDGRPLFAGHAALPWPDAPHLVLWHAQTLLREFRGDAHVAALMLEGLTGLDVLVSHAASGDVPAEVLRTSRAWSEEEWAAGVEGLVARGIVEPCDSLSFTEAGRQQRERIESLTDAASVLPYTALGEGGCARLRELCRPFSQAIVTQAFGGR
jgi:hypothetical protein